MLDTDTKDLKRLERDLKEFAGRAFPFATKATLNTAAFDTRKRSQKNIAEDMVNRNKFTQQSIRVEQTKTLNVNRQEAIVGSIAEYLERQEFGGVAKRDGKHGAVIPTGYSAGQEGQRPRTKLPRKANSMKQIQLRKRLKGGKVASSRQAAFLRGLIAAREGDKFVFIPGGEGASPGIYRVWGRKRVKGQYTGIKLKMVYSMRKVPTRTPRNAWLKPATDETQKHMPEFYRDALRFQLKRAKVLGYR